MNYFSIFKHQQNAFRDQVFSNTVHWPKYWDLSSPNNITRYTLEFGTEEYNFVSNNFGETLKSNVIVKIERIQNRRTYKEYLVHLIM